MVTMVFWLLLGTVLAAGTIEIVRRFGNSVQRRVFAVLLVIAAGLYVVIAAASGAQWVWLESIGLALFSLLAWGGLRVPHLMVVGWLLHTGWDGVLHLMIEQPVVGEWLPLSCIVYDIVVAGYITRTLG